MLSDGDIEYIYAEFIFITRQRQKVWAFPGGPAVADDLRSVADRARKNYIYISVRFRTAQEMKQGTRRRPPDMVARVVGDDSRGPTPSDLSSRSLLQRRRERERESLVNASFFSHSTPQREQQNDKVLGAVTIFLVSTYVVIVYVTSMNIVHYLSAYSRVQSVNECETE